MERDSLKKLIKHRLLKNKISLLDLEMLTHEYDFEKRKLVLTDESKWFPSFDELEDEYSVLRKEIKEHLQIEKEYKEIKYKCDHSVIIKEYDYHEHWGISCRKRCAICGKEIELRKEKEQIEGDFMVFTINDFFEPNNYDVEYDVEIKYYYTENDVLNLLLEVCNNSIDEEIDFYKELEHLELERCEFYNNENKKLLLN